MTERLTLYTTPPAETPDAYKNGTYQRIVGVEHNKKVAWSPEADQDAATRYDAEVPADMAANTLEYFDKHYVKEPDLYRNCHIGAAAITGAGFVEWIDALDFANNIMRKGRELEGDLQVGEQGVIGTFIDGDEFATHSVVGLAPGLGIQTDSENGAFSLVSHPHNIEHYQQVDKQLPGLKLYHKGDKSNT